MPKKTFEPVEMTAREIASNYRLRVSKKWRKVNGRTVVACVGWNRSKTKVCFTRFVPNTRYGPFPRMISHYVDPDTVYVSAQ